MPQHATIGRPSAFPPPGGKTRAFERQKILEWVKQQPVSSSQQFAVVYLDWQHNVFVSPKIHGSDGEEHPKPLQRK